MATEEIIKVTLKDGSEVSYAMRGLREGEVDEWAAFCASVFAYKANPPPASYFGRHYYNDPERSSELIRVVLFHPEGAPKPQIVASCRVFRRTISFGNGNNEGVQAGGIGEVCTDDKHRRRGLSKLLLKDAIRIMTDQKMKLSLLHAGPAFFKVYESSGYACTLSCWSVVTIEKSALKSAASTDASKTSIRLARFPSDTQQLRPLHQKFTEARFAGSIIRSEAYWNDYLSKELEETLWTMTESDKIIAWMSVRSRGEDRIQVREFGYDVASIGEVVHVHFFTELLWQATNALLVGDSRDEIALHLPTFILDDIRESKNKTSYIDWSTEAAEDDHGWMYRKLGESELDMPEITKTRPHLIWPSDSF